MLLPTTTLDENVEEDEAAILVSLVCATCCHSLASSDLDSFRTVDCSVLLWYSDCIWLDALSACSWRVLLLLLCICCCFWLFLLFFLLFSWTSESASSS